MQFEDQRFENKTLDIDYNQFIKCTFVDCTLIFHGDEFDFVECIHERSQIRLTDAAGNTIQRLGLFEHIQPGFLDAVFGTAQSLLTQLKGA